MKGLSKFFEARKSASQSAFAAWLVPAMLLGLLAGHADVLADATPADDAVSNVARTEGVSNVARTLLSETDASVSNVARTIPRAVTRTPVLSEIPNAAEAGFAVRAQDAIEVFRAAGVVSYEEFLALSADAKARAFSAAGLTDRYALETMKAGIQEAIDSGLTSNDWLGNIENEFERAGLSSISDRAWHMRLVMRQNAHNAYSAGRWKQMKTVRRQRPYLQFVTAGDDRVRYDHAQLDGVIRPADDPWWKTHYPPLAYNCRCIVVSLSQDELEAEGLNLTDPEALPAHALDSRFARDPDSFGALEVT